MSQSDKLVCLFVEVGRVPLLKLLLCNTPRGDVKSFLSTNQEKLRSLLEQDLIPSSVCDNLACEAYDTDTLDISTLLSLLCFVWDCIESPTGGWNQIPPLQGDNSIGACLLHLKEFRNEFLDGLASNTMDDYKVKGLWTSVKEVLKNIAKSISTDAVNDFKRSVKELENRRIDPATDEQKTNLQTMLKWYEQDVKHSSHCLCQTEESVSHEVAQLQREEAQGMTVTDGGGPEEQASRDTSLHLQIASLEKAFSHIRLENNNIPVPTRPDPESLREIQGNLKKCREQLDGVKKHLQTLYSHFQLEVTYKAVAGTSHGAFGTEAQMTKPQPQTAARSPWQAPMQQKPHVQATTESATHTYALLAYASANRNTVNQTHVQAQTYRQTAQPHNQTAQPHNWFPRQQVTQRVPTRETRYQPISDKELREYSHSIGRNWELTSYSLGYVNHQVISLKELYPYQAETRNYVMLKQWHDVVLRCKEDVRLLLAQTFVEEGNNEAAEAVIGAHRLLELQRMGANYQPSTKNAIENISFERKSSHEKTSINIGASGAVNVFPGSEMVLGAPISIGSGGDNGRLDLSSCIEGLNQLQPGSDVNIGGQSAVNVYNARVETKASMNIGLAQNVRGEMCDSTDSGLAGIAQSSHNNEFKKVLNDSWTHSQVRTLDQVMASVGVVYSHWRSGTTFRVGSHYLVTAYHVVRDIKNLDNTSLSSVSVHFHEDIGHSSPHIYRLRDDFRYDEKLDIAILEIVNPDENLPRSLPLSSGIIEGNIATLSLIGYGNPDRENTRHLDPSCQVIPQNSPVIYEAHSFLEQNIDGLRQALLENQKDPCLVDLGYAGFDASHNVIINCYSEKGASGGPLVDCRNPKYPQVLGVLTHGLPVCFWELKKDNQLIFPKQYRLEVGTRMTAIKEFISEIDEELGTQFCKDWFS